jgi:hypothetical protein
LYLNGRLHGFLCSMASAGAVSVMAMVTVVVVSRGLVHMWMRLLVGI